MSYVQIQRNRDKDGRTHGYVYLAASRWNRERKRSAQVRVYLGGLDEGSGEVVVGKCFPLRAGTRVPLAELRARVKAGEDVEAWLRMPLAEPPAEARSGGADVPAGVLVVGDVWLLQHLADSAGLAETLARAFGGEEGQALLALAFHQVAEGRPVYLAQDWLEDREVPEAMKGHLVSQAAVYGLLVRTGADYDARQAFLAEWIGRHGGGRTVICDTTSISTYSKLLEQAEWGYNRDGEDLPQINLCLAVNRDSRMPVWYRSLPGSIPDVRSLALTAEFLADFGMGDFSVSLDRGFFSNGNLRGLIDEGLDFVIGAPWSLARARRLVGRLRAALGSPKRSFAFGGKLMRHIRTAWEFPMGEGEPARELDAHLFFDPQRQAEQVARLEEAVFAIEGKAAEQSLARPGEARAWLAENAGGLRKCFAIRPGPDGTCRVERKPRAVARAAATMGYTLVLTTRPGLGAAEALAEYRCRDQVEKLFDALKNEDGQHRLRTGVAESAEGRLLLAFAALAIRAALECRMRDAGLLDKMTTAELLAQMRKVKAVTTRSGKRILLELTKRQRELLARLKVPLPE